MKRILMAMGLIAFATSLQAASIDWKITATSSDVGTTVYILASAGSYDSVEAFTAAALAQGDIAKVGNRSYYADGTITDSAVTKSTAKLYAAVLASDAKSYKYLELDVGNGMVYDLTAEPPESPSGTLVAALSDINSSNNSGTIGESSVVPEPTSGLLMLLGMAGLALKRKRA